MIARVRTLAVNLDKLEDLKEEWPRFPKTRVGKGGFQQAMLLIDRKSGKGYSITFWESEEAMKKSQNDQEYKDAYQVLENDYQKHLSVDYCELICHLK